jgi:myosin heavy subunit
MYRRFTKELHSGMAKSSYENIGHAQIRGSRKQGYEDQKIDPPKALERRDIHSGQIQTLNAHQHPNPGDSSKHLVSDKEKVVFMVEKAEHHRDSDDHDRHRIKGGGQEMTKKMNQMAKKQEEMPQHSYKRLEDRERHGEKEKQNQISQLERKLAQMQKRNKDLEDHEQQRAKEKQEMTNRIKQMAEQQGKMQQRNKWLEDREKLREKEKEKLVNKINQMGELAHVQHQNRSLEEDNRRQSEELRIMSSQLRAAEAQYQETRQLLERKTSELKGAQTFLSNEDSLSGADVIEMVSALNAEILQISAFTADVLESVDRDITGEMWSEEGRVALEQASQRIGDPLVRALTSKVWCEAVDWDPLPLQIALQIALVCSSTYIIGSWMPGEPHLDELLTVIYSGVQEAG